MILSFLFCFSKKKSRLEKWWKVAWRKKILATENSWKTEKNANNLTASKFPEGIFNWNRNFNFRFVGRGTSASVVGVGRRSVSEDENNRIRERLIFHRETAALGTFWHFSGTRKKFSPKLVPKLLTILELLLLDGFIEAQKPNHV